MSRLTLIPLIGSRTLMLMVLILAFVHVPSSAVIVQKNTSITQFVLQEKAAATATFQLGNTVSKLASSSFESERWMYELSFLSKSPDQLAKTYRIQPPIIPAASAHSLEMHKTESEGVAIHAISWQSANAQPSSYASSISGQAGVAQKTSLPARFILIPLEQEDMHGKNNAFAFFLLFLLSAIYCLLKRHGKLPVQEPIDTANGERSEISLARL